MDLNRILILTILTISNSIEISDCANILVVSPAAIENQYYMLMPLAESLLSKGHKITVVAMQPFPQHNNLTQIVVENPVNLYNVDPSAMIDPRISLLKEFEACYLSTEQILHNTEFQTLLSSDIKFDLVISTDLPYCFGVAAIEQIFNTSGVTIISKNLESHVYWMLGEHYNPAYQPEIRSGLDDQMTFPERMYNVYSTAVTLFITYTWMLPLYEDMLDSFTDQLPMLKQRTTLNDVISSKSLVLIHSHHTIDYNHAHSPRIRYVAGMSLKDNQTLPKNFEDFINKSPQGVILISCGNPLNEAKMDEYAQRMLAAFNKIPQKVIWQTNISLKKIPANILISNRVPRQQILAHRKLQLYVTDGSGNSATEAVHYGVPLIVVPITFEQQKFSKKVSQSEAGIVLEPNNITIESLVWGIGEVVSNPKYKKSATRRAAMFQDRLLSPVDEATYWVEFVLRHGRVLIPASSALPFYKVYMLDVILMASSILFAILYLIYIVVKYLINRYFEYIRVNRKLNNKKTI